MKLPAHKFDERNQLSTTQLFPSRRVVCEPADMTSTIGIPIKLLNEAQVCVPPPSPVLTLDIRRQERLTRVAQGHIITLEIDSGQTYRGKLIEGKEHYASRSRPLPPR